jgi:hypothetical protein
MQRRARAQKLTLINEQEKYRNISFYLYLKV